MLLLTVGPPDAGAEARPGLHALDADLIARLLVHHVDEPGTRRTAQAGEAEGARGAAGVAAGAGRVDDGGAVAHRWHLSWVPNAPY